MSRLNTVCALDLGTTKVCCAIAEYDGEDLHILGLGEVPTRGIRKGAVVDIDLAAEAVAEAVDAAEQVAGVPIDAVVAGFSGGRLGSGKQWISWIHIDDAVGLVLYAIDTQSVQGPLNLVSPEPMQQEQFTKAAAHILRRPAFFPTPSVVITTMLGETSTLLLDSHRVAAPQGIRYRFRYSTLENALRELLTSRHHEDVAS